MRKFRSRPSSACERSGERSAVMSCATNWPTNGQPAATVASSRPSASASVPSQAPPADADHVQQRLVGRERRQVGEHPAVAPAVDRRVDHAVRRQAVVARQHRLRADRHGTMLRPPSARTRRRRAARPAPRAGRPRGSRPGSPRCRTGRGGSGACRSSRSISRYAARGSPSRGWPTEPGLSSQRPSASSISLPPFASPPASASPFESRSAIGMWLWPTSTSVAVVSSSASRTAGSLSTYSQTGSRGLAWKSSTPWRSPFGSSDSRNSRASGSSSSIVQRALVAASGEKSSRSTLPIAARSWLPSRQRSECARASVDAAVRLRAVADDVAEAPDLVDGLAARCRRAPPRMRASCRGCRR